MSRLGRAVLALTQPDPHGMPPGATLRVVVQSKGLSRGKIASQAVHAALLLLGCHPGCPVVVVGGNKADIEAQAVTVHDAGRTEVEPGTLTAGASWRTA